MSQGQATMGSETSSDLEAKFKLPVMILSIVIPLVVAVLFRIKVDGYDLSFLPNIYAGINALTALLLVAALVSVKQGNTELHKKLMFSAVLCSVAFLLLYVAYHLTSDSTIFGDVNGDGKRDAAEAAKVGSMLYVYTFVLLSHIALSMVVLPLVMHTYLKGWAGNVAGHRKWAKITFPIWLYVAVSGVVVFFLIRPYYS